jgi:hypothetical protein
MAIRKLLLPLTGTAAGEAALATCLMIARLWNAHVTALHVRVDSRDVAPLAGEGLSGAMIEEMMSATEKESSERAHAVRSMFDRFVLQHDVILSEGRPGAEIGRQLAVAAGKISRSGASLTRRGAASGCGQGMSVSDALLVSGRPVLTPRAPRRRRIGFRVPPNPHRRW